MVDQWLFLFLHVAVRWEVDKVVR